MYNKILIALLNIDFEIKKIYFCCEMWVFCNRKYMTLSLSEMFSFPAMMKEDQPKNLKGGGGGTAQHTA